MHHPPKTYHQATSYDRYAMDPHALDWAHQPNPYKVYDGLDGLDLPEVEAFPELSLLDVYGSREAGPGARSPDLETLSGVCLLAAGLTARSRQGEGWFYFRGNPSAGALYPNELYVAAFDVAGLIPGIYHVGVHNRRLTRIREGQFASRIAAAIPGLPENCAGVFVISGIFFRSAWKYRKRAYRYLLLDGGHLAENLRLAVSAFGGSCRIYGNFRDDAVDALLGLDPEREGSLCCVGLAGEAGKRQGAEKPLEALPPGVPAASRVSPREIAYPEIRRMHEAAKIITASEPPESPMGEHLGLASPDRYAAASDTDLARAVLNYPESVIRRRSKRNFIVKPMDNNQLTYLRKLIYRAAEPACTDHPATSGAMAIGFVAGNISGVDKGFYILDPAGQRFGQVFPGDLTGTMADTCLNQAWLANAGIQVLFMTNLARLEKQWGARGYRYAMLAAGRLGQAIYLGATALGLGCCGIGAFYDGEARTLLGMNEESAMLYLLAVGRVKG